jgi:hypothetical protein
VPAPLPVLCAARSRLLGPDRSLLASSSERIGEDVLVVRRDSLTAAPGNYTLEVTAVAGVLASYTIKVALEGEQRGGPGGC